MTRLPIRPLRPASAVGTGLAMAFAVAALAACAQPTPTPAPTATPEPSATTAPTATEALPTPTETVSATATTEPTATTLPPTAVPTRQAQAAATKPKPPPAAAGYKVEWWADQAHLPEDLGCTQINWNVVGAKEVYLRWPNQDEQKVAAQGRQEGVCIDEGERAVFTLRVVKQDGTNDVREMALERDG